MSKEALAKKFAEDKDFAEKVLALDSLEDARALFASEGLDLSDEESAAFFEGIETLKDESMSDEDLDQAVGGLLREGSVFFSPGQESFRDNAGLR